ncbi:hypothetical protein OE88DRAFT_1358840 [Heliocybe sulcata]|uniref:Copper-fist domain-containing protein n=1 Tax=Heliocybe sulcata TaxID=5364 RepID=A0A5C3N9X3_9AGAM|nr:hypothetical protein OE88DRAFT_1358840 [Heliocybe sulcata]
MPEGSHHPHLRPVLPRPSPGIPTEASAPSVPPGHPNHARHQMHNSMYYSPYSRTYEQVHVPGGAPQSMSRPAGSGSMVPSQTTVPQELYQMFANTQPPRNMPAMPGQNMAPQVSWPSPTDAAFPLCNCGDSCACPGCLEHRGPSAAGYMSFQTCANPNSCSSCLSCSVLSLPYEASTTGFNDAQSYQLADELLARIPDIVGPQASTSDTLAMSQQMQSAMMQGYMTGQGQAWPNYLGGSIAPSRSCGIPNVGEARTECCGGQCKCPPGRCSCPSDCCGCCQGCACGHDHEASGSGLTFAVSGERGTCCSHHRSRSVQGGMPGSSQYPNYGSPRMTASSSTSAQSSSRSTSYQSELVTDRILVIIGANCRVDPYAPSTTSAGSGSCCSTRNIPRSS